MSPNIKTLNTELNSHHLVVTLKSDGEHQDDGGSTLKLLNCGENLMKPKLKFDNDEEDNDDDSTAEPLSDMSSSGSVDLLEQQKGYAHV